MESIGFIGGGRVTKILLTGWKRAKILPANIIVSDINPETLESLQKEFSSIQTVLNDSEKPAACDIVFIGLHPPVILEMINKIKSFVRPSSIIISLAPKISISALAGILGGQKNIVRIIPNAPSIVHAGYNPLCFSKDFDSRQKAALLELLDPFGESPEVQEDSLEAYALLTGMGPTYFWFQLYELSSIIQSFGLSAQAVQDGFSKMLAGSVRTMLDSGLSPADVMNLVPVKPLGEDEEAIRELYRTRLKALFTKLKN